MQEEARLVFVELKRCLHAARGVIFQHPTASSHLEFLSYQKAEKFAKEALLELAFSQIQFNLTRTKTLATKKQVISARVNPLICVSHPLGQVDRDYVLQHRVLPGKAGESRVLPGQLCQGTGNCGVAQWG